ncbi:Ubiquitin-like-specific protease 2 [Quillaja saponaria]|uniref:Ubiquitin-like-specific protease 2 n=1 Tax=Quillaja saponaria TaxID=32244 RepID=A0AAD7LWV5_QUISA|nr:Ubiquitin-like-specific protease 2 [Quillaja saponaria]
MKNSPCSDLGVFDFKEEGEVPEKDSKKHVKNFKNPSLDDQSILKYESLGHVSQVDKVQTMDIGSIPCVDIDAVNNDCNSDKGIPNSPLGASGEKFNNEEKYSHPEAVSVSDSEVHEKHHQFKLDNNQCRHPVEPGNKDSSGDASLPLTSQLDFALSESPPTNEPFDVNSDADECMNEDSTLIPSEIADNGVLSNDLPSNQQFGSSDMENPSTEVVLYPDYVIYQDNYYTGPQLTFSYHGIKINYSTVCGNQGKINFEWAIDNLIDIKCQLYQSVETVMIKLHVISTGMDELNNVCGASGIEELNIAVVDPGWSERYKEITSLNVKYTAIWHVVLEMDMASKGDDSPEQRPYFPNIDEPFDEVIYPKGDGDAVSISKSDVDLLQPDIFVNDTIIDFYIKYLENQIQLEEKHRFHFFNSFFFRKLADLDKNPSSASDGKAAFLRVRKWTRKVNLFEKDYIFIPVNFNLHWSLIVICHPGEVVNFKDEEAANLLKVPCILHMDSIKGTHAGLKNLLQSYLWEEWKERRKEMMEDLSSKFFKMRFVSLELPQQANSSDCGLFLLHYLELFLAEAPANFSPFQITKFSNFLNPDWFPPAEASLKRTLIQRLVFDLLERGYPEASSSSYSDEHDSPKCPENDENENGVEFLSERYSPEIKGSSTIFHTDQGIEITLLSAASSLDPQSVSNSGLVLRELFEPGATAGSLLGRCESFDNRSSGDHLNSAIFPMEEDTDMGEQLIYFSTDSNLQQMAGNSMRVFTEPYLSRGFGAETSYKPAISLQAEHDKTASSPEASNCITYHLEDIGISETCPIANVAGSPGEDKQDENKALLTENIACFTETTGSSSGNLPIAPAAEGSQDSDMLCHSNEKGVPLRPDQKISAMPLHQVSDTVDNKVAPHVDVQMIDDLVPECCEEQAAKRLRLT